MIGEHDVFLDGQPAGKVRIVRHGLYYRITCHCSFPEEMICKLIAKGKTEESLGIPVPVNGEYTLEKSIPIKNFPEGDVQFLLTSGKENKPGVFYPLCPEEPFRYIERLKTSYLAERNGRLGVVVSCDES